MDKLKIYSRPEYFRQEERGWAFTPFKDPDLAGQIEIDWATFHTVSMEPGSIRGNHYHPALTEWLMFCGRPLLLVWQDPDSETIQRRLIDDFHTLVVIPPGVKHTVKNTGGQVLYLVAFRSPPGPGQGPEVLPAILIE
jgi:dTDP-4-dehydrorhamnose 3,5-epimerase-like enzyme